MLCGAMTSTHMSLTTMTWGVSAANQETLRFVGQSYVDISVIEEEPLTRKSGMPWNAIVSMAAAHTGTPHKHLSITCPGCFLSYGDFVATYYKYTEGLIKLLMNHGLIPEKKL
ncbi:hypothetical protein E2C01_029666 [Portunus trituberculatus]|uniref:Uncharacterized protein n=1 Tax=Portunus trituberculatus TaxID=210409 RepID=A0A5B7ESJ2_PORTR|nr:hypothetical protein [Portunus trituberculatus]